MAWFRKKDQPADATDKRVKIPEGLWVKCNHCREIIYKKELERNGKVCPKCDYHFPIDVTERIALLVDEGSFAEREQGLAPLDPLAFRDTKKYQDRLRETQERLGVRDALILGDARLDGAPLVLAFLHFGFMGGSMGSVVGEKLLRGVERAIEINAPFLVVTSSGGARMQEGILSLMQMAKTAAAIGRLKARGLPYMTLLTDPTYGGVTASFAMLGDLIMAEPKALIGFAGPRVIEQTIKQKLPEGFQRAEFLLRHGMIDLIVERKRQREMVRRFVAWSSARGASGAEFDAARGSVRDGDSAGIAPAPME
ncbi:MAG: acetyl-CoA carboxylase, carboxyltransferase subunit beta [Nitrospirota bacterium]